MLVLKPAMPSLSTPKLPLPPVLAVGMFALLLPPVPPASPALEPLPKLPELSVWAGALMRTSHVLSAQAPWASVARITTR